MYADDLLLLSASISTLQSMINMCADEMSYLDMHFNVSKSAVRPLYVLVNDLNNRVRHLPVIVNI